MSRHHVTIHQLATDHGAYLNVFDEEYGMIRNGQPPEGTCWEGSEP